MTSASYGSLSTDGTTPIRPAAAQYPRLRSAAGALFALALAACSPGHSPTAESADASIERLEWAEDVLRQLPPAQAEVVMLRVIVGLGVSEVARLIDKSPGAVRVLAHRGLERVLEILADQGRVAADAAKKSSAMRVTDETAPAMVRLS